MKRIAIIDIGTNTFNLLVGNVTKKGFQDIFSTKIGVGLGLGGINDDRIHSEAMRRGLDALQSFAAKCKELDVGYIYAIGTSAIRNAINKNDFIEKVKAKTGIDITVISGAYEAEYIYNGVASGIELDEPFLIMDIGGGSTEFIYGNASGMIKAQSFEIGAARIYQLFDLSDPLTLADCEKIEEYLEAGTGDFFDYMDTKLLIGASGSFETFYELISNKPYPKNEYVHPSFADMNYYLERIIASTLAEREKDDRIIPIRKKMAPIAAVKIRWIIRKLNIEKIMISPNSLKEGVIEELTN